MFVCNSNWCSFWFPICCCNGWSIHVFAFFFSFFPVEIGNAAKAKICLNLVKNFCGDGVQYKDIENQVIQIKSNALAVKIEGTFAFVELNLNSFLHVHSLYSRYNVFLWISFLCVAEMKQKTVLFISSCSAAFEWQWTWHAAACNEKNRNPIDARVWQFRCCKPSDESWRNDCCREANCHMLAAQILRIALFALSATVNPAKN